MQPFIRICMSGPFKMTTFSALRWAFIRSSAERANFDFSKLSRTNALTTRIAMRFSCTDPFRASYFSIITLKRGKASLMMTPRPVNSSGTATSKMVIRLGFIRQAQKKAITNMIGERTAILISIISMFCT